VGTLTVDDELQQWFCDKSLMSALR